MASTPSENSNIMDEFEQAFQECLLSLTKQEPNTGTTKEEIELEVQKTTNRFIDVARQMEAYFLQKRFLVSTMKPEIVIKDENLDLRYEIQRKEALLNKHYNRLEEWKLLLSDKQLGWQGGSRPMLEAGGRPGSMGAGVSTLPAGALPPGAHMPGGAPGGSGQHQQQQQQQQMPTQLQQQKLLQAQQMQMRMMGKMNK